MILLQELGVLGTYMCVSAILVLCIFCTVITTTESPGRGISEPLSKLYVPAIYRLITPERASQQLFDSLMLKVPFDTPELY